MRRTPRRPLRLGAPRGQVRPDEPNKWSAASSPWRTRGRDLRGGRPPASRNARRYLRTTAHEAHLSLGAGDFRLWQAARARRAEDRCMHRRRPARSATVRVCSGPHGVLDRVLRMRRSVCRRCIHDRRRLRSRRLRGAGRCCDRRRCRSRGRCRGRGRGWSGRRRSRWCLRNRRRFGCGRRLRRWGGRRHGCRRRVGGGTSRRKQRQRVDVGVAVPDAYTEMDVRHGVLGLPGRPGLGNDLTLLDVRAALHLQRTEVGERRPVTVSSRDRDREPVRGHLPRERDLAAHRRDHGGRLAERDVHATMLPTCVLVFTESELTQDRPVSGPCPRERGGRHDQRADDCRAPDDSPSRCPSGEHGSTVAPGPRESNAIDCLVTESRGRGRSWRCR
jgi:hypothetical protein